MAYSMQVNGCALRGIHTYPAGLRHFSCEVWYDSNVGPIRSSMIRTDDRPTVHNYDVRIILRVTKETLRLRQIETVLKRLLV